MRRTMVLLACALSASLWLFTIACGGDDDGSAQQPTATDAGYDSATATRVAVEEIDLETFTVGDTYTVNMQEMAESGASGTAVLTGVADGDVSVVVEVEGATEGTVSLYGGTPLALLTTCPPTSSRS